MSITEVRTRFHALIDEVDNPLLLERFFEIMKQTSGDQNSRLWSTLSVAERNSVLKSYEESKDPDNLVAHEDVMNKYSKWRKK